MTARASSTLLDGKAFLEAPRWRGDALFVSAMYEHEVLRVDLGGNSTTVTHVPGVPSGLGWRPDGTLLLVSMEDRRLLALIDGALTEVADLSTVAAAQINDMVVDTIGRAHITQLGSDLTRGAALRSAPVLRVDPDGSVHTNPQLLKNGNGVLLTEDEHTLIVGEHRGRCLTAYRVEGDGALSHGRIWAELPEDPDGICLDAEGAVWCGLPASDRFVRVLQGGTITEVVRTDGRHGIAPALGGPDGTVLFMLTAETIGRVAHLAQRRARIEVCEVDVPGVERP